MSQGQTRNLLIENCLASRKQANMIIIANTFRKDNKNGHAWKNQTYNR